MASPITPEQAAELEKRYGGTPIPAEGDVRTVQPPIPMAPVETTPQEQANEQVPAFDLTQNIVGNSLGISPENNNRQIITSSEEDKQLERANLLKTLSPEHQQKVQEATQLGTTTAVDESREAMIDRVMADDSLSLSEKAKAIQDFKNKSSELSRTANQLASDQIEEKRAAFQKAKAEVEEYNAAVEGTKYEKKPMPTLSDFGLSPKATGETIITASTPTEEEVEKYAGPVRQQVAQITAQQSVMKQAAQKQLNDQAQVEQKVKEDDDAVKAIDPDNFWNSRSTVQNIALGLALATGGYAAGLTGEKNQALEFVMKQIDNDIESQKLTNDQKLAKQKLALEKAQQILREQESKDDSELKRAQRAKIYSDINDKKVELYQQQLKLSMLKSGKGIDPMLLSKDESDKAIMYKDKVHLALNMDAAKRVKDMQATSEPGLKNLDAAIAFANQGSQLSPADQAQMTTLIRSIQGQLKDEVIGPGTISESDRKILEEVAQDPFKIMGLKSSALVSLKTLRNKLETSIEKTYKDAGIRVESMSASDAAFRKGMAKGLSVERAEALRQKIKQSRGN